MTFPFDLTPENLPTYYQQVYDELMEGFENQQITVMPCLNKKHGFVVWMVVRIKLEDEGLDEEGNPTSSMSITPISMIPTPSITEEVDPILPNSEEIDFIKEYESLASWTPPTRGIMKFPTDE